MRMRAATVTVLLMLAIPALAPALTATTWEEAVALSEEHARPILIDFYTDW